MCKIELISTRDAGEITHVREWFQKTHTGLVLSSVSSMVYSNVMGGSRTGGGGGPSLCTVAVTMAVLITGRFGSLYRKKQQNLSLT